MRIGIVLTDLDGTVLEPDGSISSAALDALAALTAAGVPVCPVTSKTAAEVTAVMARMGVSGWAGIENGAGVSHAGGAVELSATAVPLAELVGVFASLRLRTGAPARTLLELSDEELGMVTGTGRAELAALRARRATLPLFVDHAWDERLRAALPASPRLRLVRGNRFLHLQGDHCKGDAVARLLTLVPAGPGAVVACGDAPNDVELLARADVAVVVPGRAGACAELVRRFPSATVAPGPHGRGWAAAMMRLLAESSTGSGVSGPPINGRGKT